VLSQLFYGTYGMDELTSEEGFRSAFEFYQAEEVKFLRLSDEAHHKKMEVLTRWKEFSRGDKE
jgi:hypothetical protein